MNRKMIVCLIFGLTFFGQVWAESTLPTSQPAKVIAGKISQPLTIYTLETPVVCDFRQEDISQITKGLAEQSGWEIVLDPLISGQVTLNIGRTTFRNALNLLCQTIGAGWVQVGEKNIWIGINNPQSPFAVRTEVVPINHLAAQQVLNLLAKHPYKDFLALDEKSNSLSITAPRLITNELKSLIRGIDVQKPRVMIEGLIADSGNSNRRERMSQFNLGLHSQLQTVRFAGGIFGWLDPSTGETLMALAYLDDNDQLKTLSNPKVAVMSGETAEISIGQDVYVPRYTPFETTVPLTEIKPIQTGNRLRVTPRVIEGGMIQVTIEAESSAISGTGPAGLPIVYRRSASSPVLEVLDGETIVIAGLDSSLDSRYRGKFPFLGDLPLIGNLFRYSRNRRDKQEVTILITCRIIRPGMTSPEVETVQKEAAEMGK